MQLFLHPLLEKYIHTLCLKYHLLIKASSALYNTHLYDNYYPVHACVSGKVQVCKNSQEFAFTLFIETPAYKTMTQLFQHGYFNRHTAIISYAEAAFKVFDLMFKLHKVTWIVGFVSGFDLRFK